MGEGNGMAPVLYASGGTTTECASLLLLGNAGFAHAAKGSNKGKASDTKAITMISCGKAVMAGGTNIYE